MGAMPRLRLRIHGRVQGVGFRYGMQRAALDAGVGGWVRNRRDGTVEAELEGDAEGLGRVRAWAASGTRAAHVTRVEVTEIPPTGESGFRTRESE